MSDLLIKIVLAGIGAAVASFFAYRAYRNNDDNYNYICIYKDNYNTGHSDAPIRAAKCSVCLKDFSTFSKKLNLPCGHPLHPECAELLFVQKENSCPSCRRKISQEFLSAHFPKK